MVKMRGLIGVLMLVLLLPIVYSSVAVTPIKDHIIIGERAIFNVAIRNDEGSTLTYTISSETSGIDWSVQTKPLRDMEVTLDGGAEKVLSLVVEPVEKFTPGVYIVPLIVQSSSSKVTQPLKVYIGSTESMSYLPSLRATIDMNEKVDPRDPQSIKIFVENLNPRNLSGLVVNTASEIPELAIEQQIELGPGPGSKKTIEFTVKLPDTQQPKDYIAFFQFKLQDEIVKIVEKRFEVVPLTLPFIKEVSEKKSFLKNEKILSISNPGNVKNTQTVKLETGIIESLFTKTSPEAKIVKDEGRAFAWDLQIAPDQKIEIKAVTSYRMPFFIVLIIVILYLGYSIYKNPLILNKSASNITFDEGGVSGLKVTISIKNNSGNMVKEVEVTDTIPGIADVEKNVEMGTLKPSQILRSKKGSVILKWKLSEIEAKEERLISYNIKSKLNIVGSLDLARAKAVFLTLKGKRRVAYSNSYRVLAD